MEENKTFSRNEILTDLSTQLYKKYQNKELCEQYAWWLLESITKKNRSTLLAFQTISLTPHEHATLTQWVKDQIEKNIPIQYLIGSVPFIDSEILVEPPILIPRPETEWWCAEIITLLKKVKIPLRILDLCTGSGCIAVSLAKALPQATIIASDICSNALNLAKRNAAHNAISTISFIQSDLFANMPHEKFDLIIANPPYISAQEFKTLDASVKNWEDTNALIAPDNGLGIIKEIIAQADTHLTHNAVLKQHNIPELCIEIGFKQAHSAQEIAASYGYTGTVWKDLYKNDRVLVASKS